jgi:hypothetical protein
MAAEKNCRLAQAIVSEVPRSRYKSGYWKGRDTELMRHQAHRTVTADDTQ